MKNFKNVKMIALRKFLTAILFLAMVFTGLGLAATPCAAQSRVWIFPRGGDDGQNFRDLFDHPEAWEQTRSRVDVLGFADHTLNQQFTDKDLTFFFAQMNHWHLKLGLEVGAIKPWGQTGEKTFNIERKMWDRFIADGGHIYGIALDEPYTAALSALHQTPAYAVEETAQFIARVRRNYPDMVIGDIEPYPAYQVDELMTFVDALQSRLKQMNVRGLDFFRADVDWNHFIQHTQKGREGWKGVKRLEDECHRRGIAFSLIYWAADYGVLKQQNRVTDLSWDTSILEQGHWYAAVGGVPDQYVIESWVPIPSRAIPETTPGTFTQSVLDFSNHFLVPANP